MLHSSYSCMFLTVEWRCEVCSILDVLVCFSPSNGLRGVLHSSCCCMFLTIEWTCMAYPTLRVFSCMFCHGRVEVHGVLHSARCCCMFLTFETRCVVYSTLYFLVCLFTVEWRCVVCSTLHILVCFSRSSGDAWCGPLFMLLYVSVGRVEVRCVLHSSFFMFVRVEWRCVVCSTLRILVCFSRSSGGARCAPLFMLLYVSHGRVEMRGVLHTAYSCMFLMVKWRCVVCSTLQVVVCF